MKRPTIAGAAAAVLLAVAGCGGGPDVSPGPAGYLASGSSKVAFIQWHTASHRLLYGRITEGSVGGSGPAQALSVSSAPFTGTTTGNSVRLTFGELYFFRTHAHGTLKSGELTMAVPRPDGTVGQVRFSQASKADFDRAIAALRAKVRRANVLAARQQASRRRQSAHAQAEQSAQSSLNALYRESSIALGGRLAAGVARLADGIKAARLHLATEEQHASGDNKYCGAAFTVAGDAQTVDGALQNAQGAVLSLVADITIIRRDVAMATAYLRHLSRSGLPAPSQASNVIANANASAKHAIVTANSYIDQINAIDLRARTLADKMATRKCSSARSGSAQRPIPHIGQAGLAGLRGGGP